MLIGVISDTHIPERADEIPKTVFEVFKNVDMILHAGDVVSITVIDQLKKLAPTICIQGNIDRYYGLNLPKRNVIRVDKFKIGLDHGRGLSSG